MLGKVLAQVSATPLEILVRTVANISIVDAIALAKSGVWYLFGSQNLAIAHWAAGIFGSEVIQPLANVLAPECVEATLLEYHRVYSFFSTGSSRVEPTSFSAIFMPEHK